MVWRAFAGGSTIGEPGSEGGVFVSDEEHDLGARISLERDTPNAPFAITCGIYGWMFHTRYFGLEDTAKSEYERMKEGLSAIVQLIPEVDDPQVEVHRDVALRAINDFVDRFPQTKIRWKP